MNSKLPLFPIYLYEEGFEPPTSGTYYLVAKTGIYIHKETKAGNALVKVDGIPWLEEPEMELRLKLPKIPALIVGQALAFFRQFWREHKAEAYTTLLYNSITKEYKLWCPQQQVSGGRVSYGSATKGAASYSSIAGDTPEDRKNGWSVVGTIHSHCNFSAFHSGTDTHDEENMDGIHITLGHVDRENISMAASIALSGVRETLQPENCCDGVVRVAPAKESKIGFMFKSDDFYAIEFTEEEAQQLITDAETIEKEWMPKVEALPMPKYEPGKWSGSSFYQGVRNFDLDENKGNKGKKGRWALEDERDWDFGIDSGE